MATTKWRGVTVDQTTARYLDAVAAEVTRMTKAAGVPDFNVTPIPGCGSYQTSTKASAGTHAGGGAVDINAEGLTDKQARILESAARKWGGTAWFRPRTSPTGYVYGWQRHVHILRSDCGDLAYAAGKQVKAYRAGLNGLANNGPDTGNRSWVNATWGALADLASTIGDIAGTITTPPTPAPEEDIMATAAELRQIISDELDARRVRDAADRVLGGIPAGSALSRTVNGEKPRLLDSGDGNYLVGILRSIAGKVGAPIDEQAIAATVLAGLAPAVSDAVKAAVAAGVPTGELADAVVARLGERLAQP